MLNTKLIQNGKLILRDSIIDDGAIVIVGRIIEAVGNRQGIDVPPDAEIIDARGNFISPGFIDLHVHGGKGSDFMDATPGDFAKITRYHAGGGTTSLLATTASAPLEEILLALEMVHEARCTTNDGAQVLGAHIEGPYFNFEKRGCHLPKQIRNPTSEECASILEMSSDIKSMTLAPELPGASELIHELRKNNIVASCGHSNATYSQMLKAIEWGVTHVTHMFCAMSGILRQGAKRQGGVVEATLLRDELTTEVIADGKHLPAELIQLTLKSKGIDKVCAVTDAMRGAGMPNGIYTFGPKDGQEAVVKDGEAKTPNGNAYASSVVRMNDLARVLVNLVGLSLVDAVKMMTINPAKVIGIATAKGSLEKGKDADIVIMDDNFDIVSTFIQGESVYPCKNNAVERG